MTELINFDPVTHEYSDHRGKRMPSVTWILAQSGLCDFSFVDEEVRARAMQRGKNVHWMLQLEDEGTLNYHTVPKALKPFRKAYLNWKRGTGFDPLLIEHPFISPFGFAGTFDRYGILPATEQFPLKSKAVLDLKTGSAHAATKYQLCAYSVGLTGNIETASRVRRIALVLLPDGTHKVKEFPANEWLHDWSVFMEALRRVSSMAR